MSILVAIEDDLTLRLPQFFCCNCGDAEDIRPVATPLRAARFMVPGNALTLQLELPYCRRCASTAKREPVGPIKRLIIAALLALPVALIATITPISSLIGTNTTFYFAAAGTLAVVFGYYSLQRPRGKQTSYYQPVRLTQVKRQFSGRVLALTLSFTHARYAQTFATANKEAIARGVLQVVW
jgi:hypothetical protein